MLRRYMLDRCGVVVGADSAHAICAQMPLLSNESFENFSLMLAT